jgi:hypothetical protein
MPLNGLGQLSTDERLRANQLLQHATVCVRPISFVLFGELRE